MVAVKSKRSGLARFADAKYLRGALRAAEYNPKLAEYLGYLQQPGGLRSFKPRPDDPENRDEQEGFFKGQDYLAFCIGGNASGTSTVSAAKAANFMLRQQAPPRKNTPFWVVSNTYENTCNVCWGEKLDGMGFIPRCEVHKVVYHNATRNQPSAVVLKPWPKERGGHPNKNWVIEFKTFKQSWGALMGASIGGFWFSESFPTLLLSETLVRCRDYQFKGGKFCEFTPLDPWLSLEIQKMLERAPETWRIYRCNTLKNLKNLAGGQEWLDAMLASTPEELHASRLYGEFAAFENQIFPSFTESMHMVDEVEINDRVVSDRSLVHAMGTDWGSGGEHPHCTLWGYWDESSGSWTIYDEYWSVSSTSVPQDHVDAVLNRCQDWGWPVVETARGRAIDWTARPGYRHNHADSESPMWIRVFCSGGVPTVAYSKTPGSVEEGIHYIRWLLMPQSTTGEPRIKISSRCKHLLEEMKLYRRKRGQTNMMNLNPSLAKDIPLDRWNHSIDALRYMTLGMRKMEGWEGPRFAKEAERIAERHAVQIHRTNGFGARNTVPLARNGR